VADNSGAGAAIAAPFQSIADGARNDMETPSHSKRNPLSVRTRFEVFKRDSFTCRYCGQKSPDVILEVDHVVPVCDGGSDDPINLVTACWSCNRGKAYVPPNEIIAGEDPHDRAILIAERERQLREYDAVLRADRERREELGQELVDYYCALSGYEFMLRPDYEWIVNELQRTPAEVIREKLQAASRSSAHKRDWMRYTRACVRRWREEGY
jgi:hypothetical protein